MKFLSTKQTAELWGISPRRVALLASQGRIIGAVSMGNTWLIPENAEKPADSRRKESKALPERRGDDFYPYIIFMVHSEEQLSRFSPDEQALYHACVLQESADFQASKQAAEALLDSSELNVRLGAMYLLIFSCMYLDDYDSAGKYSVLFQSEYHSFGESNPVLSVLFHSYESELGKTSAFLEADLCSDLMALSPEILPAVSLDRLYQELIRFGMGGDIPDLPAYEIICLMVDSGGYYFCSILLHIYLSMFYGVIGDAEHEAGHIKRAVDLAVEHGTLFPLTYLTSTNPDSVATVLSDYPTELGDRLAELTRLFMKSRSGFSEYQRRKHILTKLTDDDYRLVSYCLRNYSVEQMAARFYLSRSGMNRRLANLYKKLGVDSKKELIRVYLDSLLDWNS